MAMDRGSGVGSRDRPRSPSANTRSPAPVPPWACDAPPLRLGAYLAPRVPGLQPPLEAAKFKVGQSNPTFRLQDAAYELAAIAGVGAHARCVG